MARGDRDTDRLMLMAVGGLIGGVLGFSIWMLTDVFVFLPVFLAIGLVTGISVVESWQRR